MHAVLTNQNTDIWNFNDNINYHVLIASSYFKEKERELLSQADRTKHEAALGTRSKSKAQKAKAGIESFSIKDEPAALLVQEP